MIFSTEIIADLQDEFKDIEFIFQEIRYRGKLPCFFISVENEKRLAEIWMEVSNIIAVNYQATLDNEFSIWNIYLFFLVKENISNELKYQIENDTFSSRKIIIEGNYNIDKIIDEHIRNSDISIESNISSESSFIPNSLIYNQIKDIEAKSRLTNEIKDAHKEIVKIIKGENHEI